MSADVEQMRRERNRRKDAERRKRNALAALRGEPIGAVPAAPIRNRANELIALGWSHEAIIHASGCTGTAAGLRLIANGTTRRAERKFQAVALMPVTLRVPESVPDTCLVPTLGATRRVRALMALGWRHEDIGEFIGRASHHLSAGRYPRMTAFDWRLVDAAYEKLSAARGGSVKSETRARKAGFAPPLAWDDIDNPDEKPAVGTDDDLPDPVVVERILSGDWRLKATSAERAEVVARWTGSLADLARLTGWKVERYGRKESAA